MMSSDRSSRHAPNGAARMRLGPSPRIRPRGLHKAAARISRGLGAPRPSARQRGQVLVIVAFAMVGLLGMVGVAIDLGLGFAHRRQVANAAEAAAIAGAQALSRHIVWTEANATGQLTLLGLPNEDPYPTGGEIWGDMMSAAAATVKPFTDLGSNQGATPTWPESDDSSNSLEGWYIIPGTTEPNGVQGAVISSGVPPATAVGVRVEARLQYVTFAARMLGFEYVSVFASARAVLKPQGATGPGEGGPFIVCGGGGSGYGSLKAVPPMPLPEEVVSILNSGVTPPTVNDAYFGWTFYIHGPRLDSGPSADAASCDAGARYKGVGDPDDACVPIGTEPMPCTAQGQPGDAVRIRDYISGLNGCSGTVFRNCVAALPITVQFTGGRTCTPDTCPFTVVTYGCYYIQEIRGIETETPTVLAPGDPGVGNGHWGTLIPACTTGSQTGPGVINPLDPGAFTYVLVPDCDVPTANTCVQR
jgi:hypothetical protein